MVTKEPGVHTHPGDPGTAQVQQVVSTLQSFAEGSTDSVRNSVASATCDVMQRLPAKSSLERLVRRKRQRTDSAREIPHSRNFDIPPEYQEIILHDSGVHDVDITIVVCDDFETTAINAFRKEFTFTFTSGCFFHLSQCVIRKIASVGLKSRYENDSDFSVLMKCLPALAFVPEDYVIPIFEELALTLLQEPEVEEVVYFESTYIRGVQIGGCRRDPRFPIELWNHFDDAEECAPKPTNCCEGFHNALKSVYMCAHPTMWKFLKGIARDIAVQRLVHHSALIHRCDAPNNNQWPPSSVVKIVMLLEGGTGHVANLRLPNGGHGGVEG
ncbi:hypothetical protein Pmani_000217 [Petrolisthes manimaculis]|uniref:MULE transposase domain-containing protein n=1 Tax=Petrolisthes manimaculis TaxID=1843537 RepID=A0AAE1QMK4_9EUCA|nr:hypothetical protein Pmani_000217 [Petrolisthes manimaculis]